MRGKPDATIKDGGTSRITPADAGKTLRSEPLQRRYQDHPRGCGENAIAFNRHGSGLGSPPRMRGKRVYWANTCTLKGITPADAGKTCSG